MINNASALHRLSLLLLGGIGCAMLSACSGIFTAPNTGTDLQALAACTGSGSMFDRLSIDDWAPLYHSTVAKVIEAHMDSLKNTATLPLQCTAPDYASMVKPTSALRDLAAQLSPWKEDPEKLQALSETELGPVLLEYLRIYECALNERREYLPVKAVTGATTDTQLDAEMQRQTTLINHELNLARPTLDRTLQIVGGEDRLRPLSLDIECLKRTSLDIRNILGLVSQVSACLPRIRDARGSLRDLPSIPANP